jgi:hypothetical protein
MAKKAKQSAARKSGKLEIKIERNIPLAPRKGNTSKYGAQLEQMKVGDSFALGDAKPSAVRAMLANWTKRSGKKFKFAVRQTDQDEWRCWRVA